MKAALLILLPGGLIVLAILFLLRRSFTQDHVSEAWMIDNDRRQWGAGDTAWHLPWKWPYRGYKENANFNAAKLRKRA